MVAGNGDRLLTAAAEAADIVQITGYSGGPSKPTHFSWDGPSTGWNTSGRPPLGGRPCQK